MKSLASYLPKRMGMGTITIRCPEMILDELRALAKSNGVSNNRMILAVLSLGLAEVRDAELKKRLARRGVKGGAE